MTNIYECARCVENQKFSKDKVIFSGTRKDVRKHLRDSHGVKGEKGRDHGGHKSLKVDSDLTKNTIAKKF